MIREKHIAVSKQARIMEYGNLSTETEYLWIACHGYGQMVERFATKFSILDPQKHFVLCPEGLSRFYTKGFSGDIGASWMTRQDRLLEIEDYCNYLDTILEEYSAKAPKAKLMLFGFSQGCATVCRWLYNRKHDYQKMILWAGLVPEDLDWKRDNNGLKKDSILFVYGDQDQFIKEDQLEQYRKYLNDQSLEHISFRSFEGIHRVDKEVFRSIVKDFIE